MSQPLKPSLDENKKIIEEMFAPSLDFYAKDISFCGYRACIFILEGLSSVEKLWIMMLDALHNDPFRPKSAEDLFAHVKRGTAIPVTNDQVQTAEDALKFLTAGAGVILIDGVAGGIVISTQSLAFRAVSEPNGEGNVKGSREGFTELFRVNMSLIRRLVRTEHLCIESFYLGEDTKTEVGIFYHEDLAPKKLLDKVRAQLKHIDIQMLFDTGPLAAFLDKRPHSLFSAIGYTERPATAAAKLCEGKIVILANGSPFALVLPTFFSEHFTTMDDYSSRPYFATLLRILRYTAFLIAVLLPGIFVAVANFTPELFSQQLLYKIAAAEKATPMPLFLEAIFVNFMLEIVREAGLRMPKAIGHSVSLVAALIIGDAAIRAGILGTPVVVVSALTSLASYAVPSLYEPIILLRLLFILAGGMFGPLGIVALGMVTLYNISGVYAFGAPYLAPLSPFSRSFFRDGILRAGQKTLSRSGPFNIRKLPGAKWGKER